MKIFLHKLRHWEYWPTYIIYAPTFFLWVWWMIRFRSFKFYKYANPIMKNGGLNGDSKMKTYLRLPESLYPKTVLIEIGKSINFDQILSENNLNFPLIVKPDTGCRGVGVERVNEIGELVNYSNAAQSGFLIQEVIDYKNEIGLFYCRMPNETKGSITGITIKKFLTVIGNGKNTIEELMSQKLRFKMQIPKLRARINPGEVLPAGVEKCLVPFGNHNRGTEFLDGKELISEELLESFDFILSKVDGFYYGRLDVRYNDYAELERGENFSIIEINGVKSEPTHIYDPKHSFWYGQREIFRHQRLMKKIIDQSKKAI